MVTDLSLCRTIFRISNTIIFYISNVNYLRSPKLLSSDLFSSFIVPSTHSIIMIRLSLQSASLLCTLFLFLILPDPSQGYSGHGSYHGRPWHRGTSTAPSICSFRAVQDRAMSQVFNSLISQMQSNPSLIPVFIRAAFHDCVPATSTKPGSGCNGSLQFELDDPANNRLDPFVPAVQSARSSSTLTNCVSVADSIQIGLSAALYISHGIDLRSTGIFSSSHPREDATGPDDPGQLPHFVWDYPTIADYYASKGFSEAEMVASCVGGHALGGFQVPGKPVSPFTPAKQFSTLYAENLVIRSVKKIGNAPGFHTLPSDDAFITNPKGISLLAQFSGYFGRISMGHLFFSRPHGMAHLRATFTRFLIKNSRLSDKTVGNPHLLEL